MSSEFANYVPVQDIAQGGGDSVIRIINRIVGTVVKFSQPQTITNQIFGSAVSFNQAEGISETISESVTVEVS